MNKLSKKKKKKKERKEKHCGFYHINFTKHGRTPVKVLPDKVVPDKLFTSNKVDYEMLLIVHK